MISSKTWIVKTLFLLIAVVCCQNMLAQDLKNHRWEDRILIVKTTYPESKQLQGQRYQIKNAIDGMIERKFVLYTIIKEDFTFTNYKDPTQNHTGKLHGKLAKIVNDNKEFEVILIGLDGGVKLRQTTVLTKTKLFNKVDSMPMRSSELRRKKKN